MLFFHLREGMHIRAQLGTGVPSERHWLGPSSGNRACIREAAEQIELRAKKQKSSVLNTATHQIHDFGQNHFDSVDSSFLISNIWSKTQWCQSFPLSFKDSMII